MPLKAMNRAEFKNWLAVMDARLGEFLEALPIDIQGHLDYSPDSLNILEEWLLKIYPTALTMINDRQTPRVDGIVRYIGETFRRNLSGCHWAIELKHPNHRDFGLPILDAGEDYLFQDSPLSMAITLAARRTGNFLSKLFEGIKALRQFYRGEMRVFAITSQAKFKQWISEMDEAINYFLSNLPTQTRIHLDYSPDSLQVLEMWLYEQYPKGVPWAESPEIYDGAARYAGETFLRNAGGHWEVNLTNPRFAFNHMPIIRGSPERPYVKCPVVLTGMSRRTGTYMHKQLETIMKRPVRR